MASNGRLTYADLDTEVEKAAAALAAEGLGRGDVVATSLPNATDVVVTFHAIARLGAVWLGLNRNLAPPEKRYILADAGAKVFLADPEVADQQSRWPEIDDPLTIVVDGHSWADRLASTPSRQYQRIRSDPFDVAAIAYTSGTTGRPKGVVQTHHNILLPGAVVSMTRGFGPELRKGDCAALTILNMQVTSTLLVAQAGGTQVLIDQTDPLTIARWIRSEKVNVWFGVPTLLQGLAKSATFSLMISTPSPKYGPEVLICQRRRAMSSRPASDTDRLKRMALRKSQPWSPWKPSRGQWRREQAGQCFHISSWKYEAMTVGPCQLENRG